MDFIGGQKTGFFLDQRINRERLGALARGMTVLNCFCYTGAFSVYTAAGGAKKVISVDSSESACAAALEHLKINGFSPEDHPVIEADMFEYLRNLQGSFGMIILDPPAFAKTKRDVPKATRGYKEINMQAMKHLAQGGMLATFSCSNFRGRPVLQNCSGCCTRCNGGCAVAGQAGGRSGSSAGTWPSRRPLPEGTAFEEIMTAGSRINQPCPRGILISI